MQYYLLIGNEARGPFAALSVREMLAAGMPPEGTTCAAAGSGAWQPVESGAWEVRLPERPAPPAPSWQHTVTTVEQTGKQWKGMLLFSVLMMLAGLLGLPVFSGAGKGIAVLLVLGGLSLTMVAKPGGTMAEACFR